MKVAQNDETNPDTQPVRPPHIPSIANTQLSPSGSSVQKRETPWIFSRMFSPLHRYHLIPRQGTPSTDTYHVMHRYAFVCLYLLFLAPLLSLETETNAIATQYDYGVDDPSLLPEQPGKPPL